MARRKMLSVRVPEGLFEAFHRLFPGYGEKQGFLLKVVSAAVEQLDPKEQAVKKLVKQMLEEEEEE